MRVKIYNLWKDNIVRQFILIGIDLVLDTGDGGYLDFTLVNFTLEFKWN